MISKPRLTQVLWSLERAGAERMVFDLITCLRERYEIRLLAVQSGSMEELFRGLGIDVTIAPPGINKFQLIQFFRREFRTYRPDILHTHLGADVWAGMVAVSQRLHPWISTAHNDDRDDPVGRHLLRRSFAKRPDQIACVSGGVKQYMRNEFGVPTQKLVVIPNGIDLSTIEPRSPRPFQDVPKLLTVGRLTKQKGHDVLLKALAKIKRPWRLDICGDGPDRLRLERLVESLGLLPRVTFLGVVSDVRQRLSEADIFCFPSRWEGQGIAMLEAAASGVPLLLSDLPVFRDWFGDHEANFAPVEDVEAWSKAIERLLLHPHDAVRMAGKAQSIAVGRGSREQMAEMYNQLYTRWLEAYAHPSR